MNLLCFHWGKIGEKSRENDFANSVLNFFTLMDVYIFFKAECLMLFEIYNIRHQTQNEDFCLLRSAQHLQWY